MTEEELGRRGSVVAVALLLIVCPSCAPFGTEIPQNPGFHQSRLRSPTSRQTHFREQFRIGVVQVWYWSDSSQVLYWKPISSQRFHKENQVLH
jgi:hypothetical protein